MQAVHDYFVQTKIAALGIRLLRPDRRDEPARHGSLSGSGGGSNRSATASKGQRGLQHHGARTLHGVFTRVAQRLLALAACI